MVPISQFAQLHYYLRAVRVFCSTARLFRLISLFSNIKELKLQQGYKHTHRRSVYNILS